MGKGMAFLVEMLVLLGGCWRYINPKGAKMKDGTSEDKDGA